MTEGHGPDGPVSEEATSLDDDLPEVLSPRDRVRFPANSGSEKQMLSPTVMDRILCLLRGAP